MNQRYFHPVKTKPTKIGGKWASTLPEYKVWEAMLKRCNNRNSSYYSSYGGRGIGVCDRWKGENGFLNFYADMGKRPHKYTIERLDNDKGYEPDNCKWATYQEQVLNQRKRDDHVSGYRGVYLYPSSGRWGSLIHFKKQRHNLGYYDTPEEAALAYNKAAIQLHGRYARLNLL